MLLFAFFFAISTVTVSSQCKWQVGSNTLNLAPLQNELITAVDDTNHIYNYSICNNTAGTCSIDDLMVLQIAPNDPSLCYEIGRWNAGLQPVYDAYGHWTFEYLNGGPCSPILDRSWIPTFICDLGTRLSYGAVVNLFGSCRYTIEIRTRYACPDYTTTTTTTTIPEAACIWNVGHNTLNLTSIQGFTLNAISGDDPQQIYSLSPCSNNINCNGDFCMAAISTISNCIQTIGRWDGGFTEPEYSNNFGGQWEFVYTNGDGCNSGPESVLSVFWNCNPFAGTGTVTAAKQTGTCIFEIHLDSNLACS